MKFGILGDTHGEFDAHYSLDEWDFEPRPDTFYIHAGDVHATTYMREMFLHAHKDHMFSIDGNHDFYNERSFKESKDDLRFRRVGDVKIAGATLWTDMSSFADWDIYKFGLNDYRMISQMDLERYRDTHDTHKKFLMNSEADIIVSHHMPSHLSVHPHYAGQASNCGFASHLENEIANIPKPPKLWICGHTHTRHMYYIGETLVVCNPRGYPNEYRKREKYEPLILDLDNLPDSDDYRVQQKFW